MVEDHVKSHYEQLAMGYDAAWERRSAYVEWMSRQIRERVRLSKGERVADIGSGTGLFLRELLPYAAPETPVLAVDPSSAMLEQLPEDARMTPVCATAEEFAAGTVDLPYRTFDAIIAKEAVHHFRDLESTLVRMAGRLAPLGRLLIVTLPPKIQYPLFPEALTRFAENHPEPNDIARILRGADLEVAVSHATYRVSVAREDWLSIVANRWMSVLSTFSDADLADGIEQIRAQFPQEQLEFDDTFAFILATRP